jgi:hypothetical protein
MAVATARRSILGDFMRYRGKVPYVWGGANPGGWDCSGALNWVLGHDLRLTLPGDIRGFDGSDHGPVVMDYLTWDGAVTVPGPPVANDLCIWTGGAFGGHIGVAAGPTTLLSALDPQYGTALTPIATSGPPGPLIFRRVTGAPGGPAAAGGGGGGGTWADVLGALAAGDLGLAQAIVAGSRLLRGGAGGGALVAAGLVGGYVLAMLAAATLAGLAGAFAISWLASRAVRS